MILLLLRLLLVILSALRSISEKKTGKSGTHPKRWQRSQLEEKHIFLWLGLSFGKSSQDKQAARHQNFVVAFPIPCVLLLVWH